MEKLIIIMAIILVSSICIAGEVYEKVDVNTLQVDTEVTETKTITHSYSYLLSQKTQIEKDMVRVQAELDYINKLITEAGKLGIVEKVEIVAEIESIK